MQLQAVDELFCLLISLTVKTIQMIQLRLYSCVCFQNVSHLRQYFRCFIQMSGNDHLNTLNIDLCLIFCPAPIFIHSTNAFLSISICEALRIQPKTQRGKKYVFSELAFLYENKRCKFQIPNSKCKKVNRSRKGCQEIWGVYVVFTLWC